MKILICSALLGLLFSVEACQGQQGESKTSVHSLNRQDFSDAQIEQWDTATLAGGCFWCVEASLEQLKGVYEVVSGYTGGKEAKPTYTAVSRGATGHAEAVQVYFDPEVRSYQEILRVFFVAHDPTQLNRQGPDVGKQYRSAVFYHNAKQKEIIEKVLDDLSSGKTYNRPIVTQVEQLTTFWIAEEYHQDYAQRNPRDRYIQAISIPKVKKVQKAFPDLIK